MCGIHLIWGKGASKESIETLVSSSRHRGPDQEAIFSPWLGLWIGVNRLKILDPGTEADQPFWAPDGKSLLILNGEIYNFKELRELLVKMGVPFTTQSDTEVLLHYLNYFGSDGLKKLNGMFALIFVDLIQKSVLVARDRNGEKPLYFSKNTDTLIISSESRGIAKINQSELDLDQIQTYYYFRSASPSKSFFKGVRAWKPSRYSTISQPSTFRWDSIPLPKKPSETPSFSNFKTSLQEAVLNQFHADVPVGMMLSGGSDSSLLYASWYQQTGTSLPAYTIQVEKKYRGKYADADAAQRFTKFFPAQHELIYVDQQIFLEQWDSYLNSVDQPIGDSAGFLTWMIGKKAKEDVKVLISGAGADELWGGYRRHEAFHHYLKNKDIWAKWANILSKFPFGREWKKMMNGIDPDFQKTILNFSALENPDPDLLEDYTRIFNPKFSELKQMLDFDRQLYLVIDVLKIQDNALMAHGVEGRSPYLDSRMLSIWKAVDTPELLLKKVWIKESLSEIGLDWVTKRKKFGFGLPLQEWLEEKGPVAKRIFSTLKDFEKQYQKSLPRSVSELCQNPETHSNSHFLTIFNLFLLADWLNLQGK
jgi:asparagine synthase (glutamine-hydrolysing)